MHGLNLEYNDSNEVQQERCEVCVPFGPRIHVRVEDLCEFP